MSKEVYAEIVIFEESDLILTCIQAGKFKLVVAPSKQSTVPDYHHFKISKKRILEQSQPDKYNYITLTLKEWYAKQLGLDYSYDRPEIHPTDSKDNPEAATGAA